MPTRIVTDSTCDLPADLITEYDISVVPCYINLEGQSYRDGVELSQRQFYEKIPFLKSPPATSAPGIGNFIDIYKNLIADGASEIISIHLSGTLSNIPNIARLAANHCNGARVTVVDGGQLSLGTGFLALTAARAIKAGCQIKEIISLIDDQKAHTYACAALDQLDFLRRSGRVSGLQSRLGSLLQIKPVLKIHEGKVTLEILYTIE